MRTMDFSTGLILQAALCMALWLTQPLTGTGTEVNHEKTVMRAGFSDEIRTKHLSNTGQECYGYTNLSDITLQRVYNRER
jgi:hypothetical protein